MHKDAEPDSTRPQPCIQQRPIDNNLTK
jgi:hypothetical protein